MSKAKKFTEYCDQGMAFSFYALIYFLPIALALVEIFTALALVFYLIKRAVVFSENLKTGALHWHDLPLSEKIYVFFRAFKPIDNPLNWPIAFFLYLCLLSVISSAYIHVSIMGFLGKVLQSAFLYFNFIECMNSQKRLRNFLSILFISLTVVSVNGIYQSFTGEGFIHHNPSFTGRISSSMRAHNDFGAYLVFMLPLLLSLSLLVDSNSKRKVADKEQKSKFLTVYTSAFGRSALFLLFSLIFLCLGLTYSRGAWIGFAISMGVLGLFKKENLVICALVAVAFFSIFNTQLHQTRQVNIVSDRVVIAKKAEPFQEKIEDKTSVPKQPIAVTSQQELLAQEQKAVPERKIEDTERQKTKLPVKKPERISGVIENMGGSGRTIYWREAFSMLKDHPVLGVGLNAYSLVARDYKIIWGGYPHNCYLQMLVEIGPFGLLSFIWLLWVILKNSYQEAVVIADPFLKKALWGAVAGFIGFLVHSFFDTFFYSVQLGSLMWVMMGLMFAIPRIANSPK